MKLIALERKTVLNIDMNNTQKKGLVLSLFFTLVAMGLHYYLSQKFYGLKFGIASGSSVCNVSAFLNCDAVSISKYSSLFGFPLALWGLITNLIFFILQLSVLSNWFSDSKKGRTLTFLFSAFIALASVVMAVISFTQLSQLCLFCAGAYILSLLSLALLIWILPPQKNDIRDWASHLFSTGKSTFLFLFAIPFLVWLANSIFIDQTGGQGHDIERVAREKVATWQAAPSQTFDESTGLILGPEKSPFVIVEFADFLCSHCKHAYPTLHAFTQAHPEVKLVFKTFPLDGTCNSDPSFGGRGDGIKCRLALASLCAEKLEKKGWMLHHSIYDQQESFYELKQASEVDAKVCSLANLDCPKMQSCMDSQDTLNELKTMAQEGIKAQITGTPSIFINGRLLQGAQLMPVLDAAFRTVVP